MGVTMDEFVKGLDDGRVQAILRTLDDGQGEVDIEEFICACVNFQGYAKAIRMEQFRMLQHQLAQRMQDASAVLRETRGLLQSVLLRVPSDDVRSVIDANVGKRAL